MAFVVEIEGSECESAEDTDAEQQATAHCTAGQQSGGGYLHASIRQRLIVWLRLNAVLF